MWLPDRWRGPPIDLRSCSPPPSKRRRISSNPRVASRLVVPEGAGDSADQPRLFIAEADVDEAVVVVPRVDGHGVPPTFVSPSFGPSSINASNHGPAPWQCRRIRPRRRLAPRLLLREFAEQRAGAVDRRVRVILQHDHRGQHFVDAVVGVH